MRMKVFAGCIVMGLMILTGCGQSDQPVTRGEVADRNAAMEVEKCARQYLGKSNSGPDTEVWIMCLHSSSELAGRNKINVAHQVIRYQKKNVFETNQSSAELSQQLIDRINRDE